MTFDEWWDADLETQTNPYSPESPVYWAWEGWIAGRKDMKAEAAKACESKMVATGLNIGEADAVTESWNQALRNSAFEIRSMG